MIVVRRSRRIEIGGHAGIFAREIGRHRGPVIAAVGCAEQPLVREIERLLVFLGKRQRQGPCAAIFHGRIGERGIDFARLAGAQIELLHLLAIDDIRIVRIRRDHAAFTAGRFLVELFHGDAVIGVGAAWERYRAGILLRAINPVMESGCQWPRDRSAQSAGCTSCSRSCRHWRDLRALIAAENLAIGIGGIDPQRMEIVAGGIALERDEMLARIVGAQHDRIHHEDAVGIVRDRP